MMNVVAALIIRDRQVLAAQRPEGKDEAGLWEFPGGKVNPGEDEEAALIREIEEELGCRIGDLAYLTSSTFDYPGKTVILHGYTCRILAGEPQPHEHAAIAWVDRQTIQTLEWAPADLPLIEALLAGDLLAGT